uniref:(northern house mosquito) hypothetical protein n=1 Tax=Culex pipiens TaxID=7175 RepID=A0A8D8DU98_CULPI
MVYHLSPNRPHQYSILPRHPPTKERTTLCATSASKRPRIRLSACAATCFAGRAYTSGCKRPVSRVRCATRQSARKSSSNYTGVAAIGRFQETRIHRNQPTNATKLNGCRIF